MKFISKNKLKIYTKEMLKYLNITLISLGFIIAIILIKYKPMYEVKISGEKIGYTQNKKMLSKEIENSITNYNGKNIETVELNQKPEYEFKLVEKTQENNEQEIIIALQKELDITYKYYEISSGEEVIEKVDSAEIAEQIIQEIKEKSNEDIILTSNPQTTNKIEEINTNILEVAKENIIDKLNIEVFEPIAEIDGIKIATLPVTGIISSRFGAVSSIRSSTHTGLDIAAASGTPIKAVAGGTVTFAKYNGAYGYLVKIDHGNNVETWYAHTSKMYVKAGQEVKAGDTIALVGNTGNSTGAHLHLEVRIDGVAKNPQKYLYN